MTINQAEAQGQIRQESSFFIPLPTGFRVPGICPKDGALNKLVAGRLGTKGLLKKLGKERKNDNEMENGEH